MKAGLGRFLWLWVPMGVTLIAGLARAWTTGQADPWQWGLPGIVALTLLGFARGYRDWRIGGWAAMGVAGTAVILCAVSAARMPAMVAVGGLAVVTLFAALGGGWLRTRRWIAGSGALGAAMLLLWSGAPPLVAPVDTRPPLAVISGLPLFWGEAGRGLDGPMDAPVVTILRSRFTVRPMDDASQLAASGAQKLLLAQPRPLPAEQLVAIDQWVRAGGTALVLADPDLRWPSALPLGDRRRAPSAHMLDPLLRHWGLLPAGAFADETRHFLADGSLVTMAGGVYFAGDLPAARRIGRGRVMVVGDADLIDDRLWLADPARAIDPRAWSADTPALIVTWLGGDMAMGRRWLRQAADVRAGIRWALLAGTIWAAMGAALLTGGSRKCRIRTNHENKLEEQQNTG